MVCTERVGERKGRWEVRGCEMLWRGWSTPVPEPGKLCSSASAAYSFVSFTSAVYGF